MVWTGEEPNHIPGNPGQDLFGMGGVHDEPVLTLTVPGNPGVGEMTGEKSVAELPGYVVRGNPGVGEMTA